MLNVGLTGGIASGKSQVAARLGTLGAIVIDADLLAREVVEPGSDGLAAIVRVFGDGVLDPGGALNRPALGALIFADAGLRGELNAIIHPLVRRRSAQLRAAAPAGAIVVQDIPLLVETGQGPAFSLVVVVDAPEDLRIRRMMDHRGMARVDAESRIAAQASVAERSAAADVMLGNTGTLEQLMSDVDRLWHGRLVPFAENLQNGRCAVQPTIVTPADSGWASQGKRLGQRVARSLPAALAVDHIGATAVPGLPAEDVIDLQVTLRNTADAATYAPLLATAGFLHHRAPADRVGAEAFAVHGAGPSYRSADPGRPATLQLCIAGSDQWRWALAFRDWLRTDEVARQHYHASLKPRGDEESGVPAGRVERFDPRSAGLINRLESWIEASGWVPPSYGS